MEKKRRENKGIEQTKKKCQQLVIQLRIKISFFSSIEQPGGFQIFLFFDQMKIIHNLLLARRTTSNFLTN